MMTAAIYGRLGQDPKRLDTSSGKLMVVASMAVTLPRPGILAMTDAPTLDAARGELLQQYGWWWVL